jgi:hypothetical protein
MRNPFVRTVYVTVTKEAKGLVLGGLGTRYPTLKNNTGNAVRVTFEVAGTGEMRAVDIPSREIAPFHVSDGKFRADFIEIIKEES